MKIDQLWLAQTTKNKCLPNLNQFINTSLAENFNEKILELQSLRKSNTEKIILFYESVNSVEHFLLFCFCYANNIIFAPISSFTLDQSQLHAELTKISLNFIHLRKENNLLKIQEVMVNKSALLDNSTVMLLRTSGTSGISKWVQISDTMVLENIKCSDNLHRWQQDSKKYLYSHLNFFHSGGFFLQSLPAFLLNAKITFTEKFNIGYFLSLVKESNIKTTILLPGHIELLKKSKNTQDLDLSDIDLIITGSQRIHSSFYQSLFNFHCRKIVNVYGATEFGPYAWVKEITANINFDQLDLGEVSNALIWKTNLDKELLVTGPHVTPGYVGQEPSEWFYTKDLLNTENEKSYFLGKKDFLIRTHGYTFNPYEIENEILSAVAVRNVSLAHRTNTQGEVKLYLFVNIDETKTAWSQKNISEMIKAVTPRALGPYKIIYVKDWPLNENGKANKEKLMSLVS